MHSLSRIMTGMLSLRLAAAVHVLVEFIMEHDLKLKPQDTTHC